MADSTAPRRSLHNPAKGLGKENAMPYRSAITGKYISKAAAIRHPKTSVKEAPKKG